MAARVVLAMMCLLETAKAELGGEVSYHFNHSVCGVQKGTNQAKGHVTYPGATGQHQRTCALFLLEHIVLQPWCGIGSSKVSNVPSKLH